MLIRPPEFIKRLYPSYIWRFPDEKNGIFLTFDDGPCPEMTPWVLDQLDRYDARATFFVLGKNVELYPKLFAEIIKRGHSVGNHSYSHISGWKMDWNSYVRDFDTADELIHSKIYRPPYAQIKRRQYIELEDRYRGVMWSIISRDYNFNLPARKCAENVLKHLAPGEILVFHDSKKAAKNLWHTLPIVLKRIKEMNLECKPIILP
ncbi:MAG: polysaccharide deacetylase family protein [Alistipes sp.]|nr:polysaccharide deacetylase family protein [Candidatus Minthomonas equi]